MHARATFIRNLKQQTKYTGIFEKEKIPLIIRYSPSDIYSRSFLPGWAFKFFRDDHLPTDDVLTYHSFIGQQYCDAFSHSFSNVPLEAAYIPSNHKTSDGISPEANNLVKFFVENYARYEEDKLKDTIATTTKKKTSPISALEIAARTGITHLFLNDEDSYEYKKMKTNKFTPLPMSMIKRTVAADALIFIPNQEVAAVTRVAAKVQKADIKNCAENRQKLMEEQLSSIPAQSALFYVYAYTPSDVINVNNYIPIQKDFLGTIVIDEQFIPSWYGDTLLHFKHEHSYSHQFKLEDEKPEIPDAPAAHPDDLIKLQSNKHPLTPGGGKPLTQ
eukprot:c21446_g1_i2.p1 GENE.c21446_g1_i2~~c21446_g1_i2.p1  ORF type:complete len:331 (+),score=126.19 c21446_g1_i2:98-1090(+)